MLHAHEVCVHWLTLVALTDIQTKQTFKFQTISIIVQVAEKKDRVVDALNATKAAVEEGIVAGVQIDTTCLIGGGKTLWQVRETGWTKQYLAGGGQRHVVRCLLLPAVARLGK